MNIQQIKNSISIVDFLFKLNHHAIKKSGDKIFYLSPIHDEKTPSFVVYHKTNTFKNYATGEQGDIIELAKLILNKNTNETIEWFTNVFNLPVFKLPEPRYSKSNTNTPAEEVSFIIVDVCELKTNYLINYALERKIPLKILCNYCKEISYRKNNETRIFKSIGFKNCTGGYEIRSEGMKGIIGNKNISLIKGASSKELDIFEGFFDFLSKQVLDDNFSGVPKNDSIILNSTSMYNKLLDWAFQKQKYVYERTNLYTHNDIPGEKIYKLLQSPSPIKTKRVLLKNSLYKKHKLKDLNEYLIYRTNIQTV